MVSFSSLLNIWFFKKNYDFLVFYAEYTLILTSLFRQTIDVQYIMFLSDWCLKNYGQYWSVYVSNFSVALSIIYKFLEDLYISQEVFSRPSQYHAMHSILTDCGLLNIFKKYSSISNTLSKFEHNFILQLFLQQRRLVSNSTFEKLGWWTFYKLTFDIGLVVVVVVSSLY